MSNGQRPSAVLLHDPYAGHRDYSDPFWIPDPIRDTQWTDWDYALAEAIAAIDLLNSPTGHPRWITEDPEVYWDVETSVDFAVQTLSEEADKFKDGVPPEVNQYVTNPHKKGDFWTMEQWLEWREEQEGNGVRLDRGAPEGARPPTSDELKEMQRLREERLAAKYAEAAEQDSVN